MHGEHNVPGGAAPFLNMSNYTTGGCRDDFRKMIEMNHSYWGSENPIKLSFAEKTADGDNVMFGQTFVGVVNVQAKFTALPEGISAEESQLALVATNIVGMWDSNGERTNDLLYISPKIDAKGYTCYEYDEQVEDKYTYKLQGPVCDIGLVLINRDGKRFPLTPQLPFRIILKHYVAI
jgi:hypothetical protein